jgi:hypothetical protein
LHPTILGSISEVAICGLLPAAMAGHAQAIPRTPDVVATDRGFGTKNNEELLRTAVGEADQPAL